MGEKKAKSNHHGVSSGQSCTEESRKERKALRDSHFLKCAYYPINIYSFNVIVLQFLHQGTCLVLWYCPLWQICFKFVLRKWNMEPSIMAQWFKLHFRIPVSHVSTISSSDCLTSNPSHCCSAWKSSEWWSNCLGPSHPHMKPSWSSQALGFDLFQPRTLWPCEGSESTERGSLCL